MADLATTPNQCHMLPIPVVDTASPIPIPVWVTGSPILIPTLFPLTSQWHAHTHMHHTISGLTLNLR